MFRDFVAQCLVKPPSERPAAAQLLKHPFLRGARRTDKWVERVAEAIRKKVNMHQSTSHVFAMKFMLFYIQRCQFVATIIVTLITSKTYKNIHMHVLLLLA